MKQYFDRLYKNTNSAFMAELRRNLENNRKTFIVTANPEAFMFGEKDPEMDALLMDDAVTVVADGIGIVKGAAMLDVQVAERIPGVDIAENLMQYGHELGKSIFICIENIYFLCYIVFLFVYFIFHCFIYKFFLL